MIVTPRRIAIVLAAAVMALAGSTAFANNLVYHPLHPTFGGDPNMVSWWFGLADAQNLFNGSGGGAGGSGGSLGDLGGIGGPVIVINPGDTTVGAPSVEPDSETEVDQVDQ